MRTIRDEACQCCSGTAAEPASETLLGESVMLVSCIMPTANRRRFVPAAIAMFLAQDYPDKELVILDDGDDAVEDLVPQHPELRYIQGPQRSPLGAKRNQACAAARGEILLHWDDDDWYAPNRLSYQVDRLLASGADLCGIDHVFFLDPRSRQAWEYVYPEGAAPWVCGATLCYRRDYWRAHPFPQIDVGEDTRFVAAARGARIDVLADNRFFVGLVHNANSSPKRVRDARWQPRQFDTVRAITGDAWPCEASLDRPPERSAADRPAALVTAASGIGDILRVTPLIQVLHKQGYAVDVLLAPDCPEAADLLLGAPQIRHLFVTADTTNRRVAARVPELSDRHYAVATFTTWSAPLGQQVKAERQLCFPRAEWLAQGDIACVEHIARSLGWSEPLPAPFAMTSDRDFALSEGTVALHPGCKSGWPWKKWHGFDRLARRFAHVVVVGTEADLVNTDTYFAREFVWPEHVYSYAGQLCLRDTAALIKQCSALVSNDSGLMHLGVALGVPSFGIFGITSPAREAIPSPRMVPVSKGLDCEPACRRRPWGRRDCEHHLRCLKTLEPEEVADRVLERLPHLPTALRTPLSRTNTLELRLAYYGAVSDASGYGEAARAYVHALHEAGVRLAVVDTGGRPAAVRDPLIAKLQGTDPEADFHLFHGIPTYWARMAYRLRNVIAMTVWETETMPPQWRNPLTHALDVWLPSHFNVDVFARALGRQPFRLPHPLPLRAAGGHSPIEFSRVDVGPNDFVFYACFEWQDRKNPNGLIDAYFRAFPQDEDTLLLIKTSPSAADVACRTVQEIRSRHGAASRVVLCCEAWSDRQIDALHERGDCYVSLHKGEGWGYPLFEAAARGKPIIATAYSGPLDYLDRRCHWLVRATPAPVRQHYAYYSPAMRWSEPDLAQAAEGMRAINSDRERARAGARLAAARLRKEYAPARIGEMARTRLAELLGRINPERAVVLPPRYLAPQVPIPGEWYDADYFESGAKSNWKGGYTWPLFTGVFSEAAAYLGHLFPEAQSFLDIGCAKGFLVRTLRERGLEAWGVDHSPWAIEHAEPAARRYLQLGDATTVDLDRQFDIAVALSLFESLTEEQLDTLLPRVRSWTRQALVAVIADLPDGGATDQTTDDLSQITLRPRRWWLERLQASGWRQDALHRGFERIARTHTLAKRMGWSVYVLSPGG
jgi:ADP-heptose:LPS heptosyltransferase/SAM-dependent methyltransferase